MLFFFTVENTHDMHQVVIYIFINIHNCNGMLWDKQIKLHSHYSNGSLLQNVYGPPNSKNLVSKLSQSFLVINTKVHFLTKELSYKLIYHKPWRQHQCSLNVLLLGLGSALLGYFSTHSLVLQLVWVFFCACGIHLYQTSLCDWATAWICLSPWRPQGLVLWPCTGLAF